MKTLLQILLAAVIGGIVAPSLWATIIYYMWPSLSVIGGDISDSFLAAVSYGDRLFGVWMWWSIFGAWGGAWLFLEHRDANNRCHCGHVHHDVGLGG